MEVAENRVEVDEKRVDVWRRRRRSRWNPDWWFWSWRSIQSGSIRGLGWRRDEERMGE